MTLVMQFFAARRDRLLMQLGCWLVCFSLVVGLMLPQQRAYAVDPLTMTAVASVAAAYLGACGLSVVVLGMDKDALVSSVQRLIQEFLDTQLGGMTIQDWLGSVWDLAVIAGKLVLGRPLTDEFVGFAQWVAQKYGAQVGLNLVAQDMSLLLEVGGSLQSFSLTSYVTASANNQILSLGTVIPIGESSSSPVILNVPGTDKYFVTYWSGIRFYIEFYSAGIRLSSMNFPSVASSGSSTIRYHADTLTFTLYPKGGLVVGAYDSLWNEYFVDSSVYDVSYGESSLSIDRHANVFYLPEDLTVDQGIALDVGAEAAMDLDQVLHGVLDDVLVGDLTSTLEVAGEVTEPIDPPAGDITDVDSLGLPALGAALTSRFPFSIPWDFFRAVQLLAAPAKAPCFEVDFLKPIEHRVGKWQGSTTVILDFSQYAVIGQVSRWASTIGFCLMLAGATKRLIWTA